MSLDNDNSPAAPSANVDLELHKQRDNNQYQYALAALQAQERDREAERAHNRVSQKTGLLFFIGIGVFVTLITFAAFYMDKEQFLLDCLRYLAVLFGGGGIGYYWGYCRAKDDK